MTDWTPGSWESTGWSTNADCAPVYSGSTRIAKALYLGGTNQAVSNARLIAAVPDLYAALDALEPYLDAIVCYASTQSEHEPNKLVADVRAALAKARGESE